MGPRKATMSINEVYSEYLQNPCDETSGRLYLALVSQAKIVAPLILDEHKLGTLDEAIQDAATTTWEKIVTGKAKYNPAESKFQTFADRIIRNFFKNWARNKHTGDFISIDDPE